MGAWGKGTRDSGLDGGGGGGVGRGLHPVSVDSYDGAACRKNHKKSREKSETGSR